MTDMRDRKHYLTILVGLMLAMGMGVLLWCFLGAALVQPDTGYRIPDSGQPYKTCNEGTNP